MQLITEALKQHGIKSISYDSKKIGKNTAFLAIKGNNIDGNQFINQAINNGARLIISDKLNLKNCINNIPVIKVENARVALSFIANFFYPLQPKNLVAVTGTNGKTSIVNFFRQICWYLNYHSASLGTMGIIKDNNQLIAKSELTTGDPIFLHNYLHKLALNNINYVAIEASSHGLSQHRMDFLKIKAAAFCSFSQDHLDYHTDMDEYLAAKMRLFAILPKDSVAIINADMACSEYIINKCQDLGHKVLDYGKNAKSLNISQIISDIQGQSFNLKYNNINYNININLIGEFQIYNIVCAIALALASGLRVESIINQLPKLTTIRGRLEKINNDKFHIFVDYAHTPAALENVLQVLKKYTNDKLIVVFGAGGDRDKSKRPMMGKVAQDNADIIIVTDDNPRSEDKAVIRQEIIRDNNNFIEIDGRENAIKYAINIMSQGDILLIAGKGHEDYQIIGKQKFNFDDIAVATKYLKLCSE